MKDTILRSLVVGLKDPVAERRYIPLVLGLAGALLFPVVVLLASPEEELRELNYYISWLESMFAYVSSWAYARQKELMDIIANIGG